MSSRRFRIASRCFALALMAVLAGDLLDAACDPLIGWTEGATVRAGGDGDADQCAGTCVPDCYCCCGLDRPAIETAADPLGFLQMAEPSITPPRPSRTTAPPDQPPLAL